MEKKTIPKVTAFPKSSVLGQDKESQGQNWAEVGKLGKFPSWGFDPKVFDFHGKVDPAEDS